MCDRTLIQFVSVFVFVFVFPSSARRLLGGVAKPHSIHGQESDTGQLVHIGPGKGNAYQAKQGHCTLGLAKVKRIKPSKGIVHWAKQSTSSSTKAMRIGPQQKSCTLSPAQEEQYTTCAY